MRKGGKEEEERLSADDIVVVVFFRNFAVNVAFDVCSSFTSPPTSLTCRPELTMRLTALPPPPPTPMTLMRASPPRIFSLEGGTNVRKMSTEKERKKRKRWHRRRNSESKALAPRTPSSDHSAAPSLLSVEDN